jgi:hypothetical protein
MPAHFYNWLDVADRKEAERLPPTRGIRVNYAIKLGMDDNGREKEVLWGLLYNMSRGELLVL